MACACSQQPGQELSLIKLVDAPLGAWPTCLWVHHVVAMVSGCTRVHALQYVSNKVLDRPTSDDKPGWQSRGHRYLVAEQPPLGFKLWTQHKLWTQQGHSMVRTPRPPRGGCPHQSPSMPPVGQAHVVDCIPAVMPLQASDINTPGLLAAVQLPGLCSRCFCTCHTYRIRHRLYVNPHLHNPAQTSCCWNSC